MNIVITGFMASGKTEISKQLHKLSGYSLVDTDELIVKKTGMSINEIFEKKGEEAFREIEHNVISEVSKRDNTIISTGGGVPLNEINMDELRKNGIIVNLAPDFDVIKQRLTNARSTRPLLKNSSLEEIENRFNYRLPYYEKCDIKINVSNEKSPKYFANQILEAINSFNCEWVKFELQTIY